MTVSAADIAAVRARAPRVLGRPWPARLGLRLLWGAALAYVVFLLALFDMTPWRLWEAGGMLGSVLAQMLTPSPGRFLSDILWAIGETVAMAFLGTTLAAVVAAPLGFLGAKTIVANPALHFVIRRSFDILRGIPALIWALIFVRAVGLGPMAGVLAIFASDLAALAKLQAEAIENTDRGPSEGVAAAGATRLLAIRYGVLPQVLPVMTGQALYFFESNVRSAAILGLVGAGGIGFQLNERVRLYQWDQVAFIILLFLVVVYVIDLGSRAIRLRLAGRGPADRA